MVKEHKKIQLHTIFTTFSIAILSRKNMPLRFAFTAPIIASLIAENKPILTLY
ncbi:MAG: hypothetical protein ACYDIA_19845 [Candidatus Humimicrobiaceae bacterium]